MSLSRDTQVTIVGGGFTGLTAAYELVKKGVQVTVLESESNAVSKRRSTARTRATSSRGLNGFVT